MSHLVRTLIDRQGLVLAAVGHVGVDRACLIVVGACVLCHSLRLHCLLLRGGVALAGLGGAFLGFRLGALGLGGLFVG